MIKLKVTLRVSVLALGLVLAGCGGGGGGGDVISTPAAPTYTKIADMSGNRTFQTAGVTYSLDATGFSNGTTNAFGSGATVAYTASSDSYAVTVPGGANQTFGPAELQPANSSSVVYVKVNGTTRDQLTLITPSAAAGVPLSYTVIGTWGTTNTSNNTSTFRVGIGGSPTLTSDVPKTGTANYTIGIGGSANSAGTLYTLSGNSSGTFSANFGAGTVQTSLMLVGTPLGAPGTPLQNFGGVAGSGTLTSGGPGFSGTLTGTLANGIFSGLFLGPQALEVGFGYVLTGGTFSAAGAAVGIKQ